MPDFLDAVIGSTTGAPPAIRPRLPGLFEPHPAVTAPWLVDPLPGLEEVASRPPTARPGSDDPPRPGRQDGHGDLVAHQRGARDEGAPAPQAGPTTPTRGDPDPGGAAVAHPRVAPARAVPLEQPETAATAAPRRGPVTSRRPAAAASGPEQRSNQPPPLEQPPPTPAPTPGPPISPPQRLTGDPLPPPHPTHPRRPTGPGTQDADEAVGEDEGPPRRRIASPDPHGKVLPDAEPVSPPDVPLRPAPTLAPQSPRRSARAGVPPISVQVSIGRIEIRAPSAPAAPPPSSRPAPRHTSLEEYLERRQGTGR